VWSVIINLSLSAFEFIAGAISGSVALMADALHNTNDAAALLVAYVARRIGRKGADRKFTFGYRRAELIGAMIQLTALIVVGLYLIYEAIRRFITPEPLSGAWIMAAAGVALVVDVFTAWFLWSMSKGSMNVKAAFLHNLTDAAASVAVLAGGAAIYWLSWSWVDPTLTLIIAGYILYMSFGMLKDTSATLMEGAPCEIDLEELKSAVETIGGLREMHHIHVWELDEERIALEAHLVLEDESFDALARIKREAKALLAERFGIGHSTLEFEGSAEECNDRTHSRQRG
jgi:cobalt-zinc-cadmium efflux system protein